MIIFETIPKAFISYASEDLAIAEKVASDLRTRSIEVWIDREGLIAGTPDWEVVVRDAVSQSFGLILIATPHSRMSSYVQSELFLAEANSLPIYPIWAAGEKWIDSIPLNLSRTQYHDIRGEAYKTGIAQLAKTFISLGYALPPHFLYRSFQQVHPSQASAPRDMIKCGSRQTLSQDASSKAYEEIAYQKKVPKGYMVIQQQSWANSRNSQMTYDAILIRPSAFDMAAYLLDELYLNYLSDQFPAFTYGTSWVLHSRGLFSIDPAWVQNGMIVVPDNDGSKGMTDRPERYNLSVCDSFEITEHISQRLKVVAATDPWVIQRLIRHPKGKHIATKHILENKSASEINLKDYPYVAVVLSHCLPSRDSNSHSVLVQVKECTMELKSRFSYRSRFTD